MKKWPTVEPAVRMAAVQRRVRHVAQLVVATLVAVLVQFAAVPDLCRAVAVVQLLRLVGL